MFNIQTFFSFPVNGISVPEKKKKSLNIEFLIVSTYNFNFILLHLRSFEQDLDYKIIFLKCTLNIPSSFV